MTFFLGRSFAIELKERQNMFFNKNNQSRRNEKKFIFGGGGGGAEFIKKCWSTSLADEEDGSIEIA